MLPMSIMGRGSPKAGSRGESRESGLKHRSLVRRSKPASPVRVLAGVRRAQYPRFFCIAPRLACRVCKAYLVRKDHNQNAPEVI